MSNWYVQSRGELQGPLSPSALKQLATANEVLPTDLVRREDMTEWESAGRVRGLFPEDVSANTPPPLPHERYTAPTPHDGNSEPAPVAPPITTPISRQPPRSVSARNRVWLALCICVVAFAGIAALTIAFSTRGREHLTANAPHGDAPASSLPTASTAKEALENARRMALSMLPTLTEYRAEESLVKHFDSNAANAEQALKQSNDILHRGGKKPRILDVLREPDKAFLDLEISPDEATTRELQKCREDIESVTSLIRERRQDIEHQKTLLTKARDGIEAERKELEASFKKFPAMSEQQKQQQRDRLESRARNTTGPINNAIAKVEQDISRLERDLAELKHKEPELAVAVAESINRNSDIYFREVNKVGPLLHAAGLPTERGEHQFKKNNLYATLFNGLHTAATQINEVVERNAPPHPSSDGLEYLTDITHIIEGNRYYMSNQVVTIPDEYESLYVSDRVGPNQVVVEGEFRFVGNSTGKNSF